MRTAARVGTALLATIVLSTTPSAAASRPDEAIVRQKRGERIAFEVDGRPTRVKVVVADLVTLARNDQLDVVSVNDDGDRVPIRGVVATWITKLIHLAVAAEELEQRGVEITPAHRAIATRVERRAYGRAAWRSFPARFRTRQAERTAAAVGLAVDEGFDLTQPRQTRRAVVELITELAKQATVTVAPRFGTWDPTLAVVVPRPEGPAS